MGLAPTQHAAYIAIVVTELLAIGYFAYKAYAKRRWIRIDGLLGIVALNAAVPAFKIAVKAYGINIDAALNDAGVGILWLSAVAVIGLVVCEIISMKYESINQRAESHFKYLHEFKTVVTDSIQNGVPDDVLAKNLGIPVDKVQAILMCAAQAGTWSKNSLTGESD